MGGARRRADQEWRLIEERDQLAGQNDRLRHLLRQLQRMQFGRRSEKLDPDQFNLALEDLEQAVAASEAEQEKADPALRQARSEKRRAGRGSLPSICRRSRSSSNRKTQPYSIKEFKRGPRSFFSVGGLNTIIPARVGEVFRAFPRLRV